MPSSCSFKAGGVITILGVFVVTWRGGVGKGATKALYFPFVLAEIFTFLKNNFHKNAPYNVHKLRIAAIFFKIIMFTVR